MTVSGVSVISLGLLACSLIACNAGTTARKLGRHEFPLVTLEGKQTANEFQLIQPHKIVDGRSKAGNGDSATYILSSISPLSIDNDDVVTVKFESSKPSSKDWIGAYSPANVDITTTVPVKYGYCDEWIDYITNGEGRLTFNFTNLRSDIAFYYFTNDVSAPIMMNTSTSIVKFKNYNEPLRPRVVPTGNPNVLNLLWSSASSVKPTLKWGTSSGNYVNIVTATTQELQKSDFCGTPATGVGYRELGQIHTAPFTGLTNLANKKIYYIFGDEATDDYSKQYVLHVPPLAGTQPSGRGTTVVLYDDLGRGSTDMTYTWNEYGRPAIYTLYSVGDLVKNGKIDAVYHGGDISYATGYLSVWDFFLDELSPVASGIPYLTTVGNHESDWYDSASLYNNSDSGGECGVATTRLIPMPEPATTNKPWWSYDVGLIHMVGMSTEHDYAPGSEQYKWLENDLATVDRKKTPWIVFGGHRAMYLNSNYGGSETSDIVVSQQMVSYLEPLLYKYRVNIGFYGHNHVVQRQSAVLNYTVVQASKEVTDSNGNIIHMQEDPQATVHFVVGTGGAAFTKTAYTPPPAWNEMFFYEYGYAIVTAVNESYLDWQWILSSTNEVLDHVVITQSDPTQPWKSSVKV